MKNLRKQIIVAIFILMFSLGLCFSMNINAFAGSPNETSRFGFALTDGCFDRFTNA